jgi:capsular polysaccharide biosynthesis protein
MPITHRDRDVQAIYITGDQSPQRDKTIATALMEAARVVLAERLNVQSIEICEDDTLVLYCDDEQRHQAAG